MKLREPYFGIEESNFGTKDEALSFLTKLSENLSEKTELRCSPGDVYIEDYDSASPLLIIEIWVGGTCHRCGLVTNRFNINSIADLLTNATFMYLVSELADEIQRYHVN